MTCVKLSDNCSLRSREVADGVHVLQGWEVAGKEEVLLVSLEAGPF